MLGVLGGKHDEPEALYHFTNPLTEMHYSQIAALPANQVMPANDLPETGTIHIGDLEEVQDDRGRTRGDQSLEGLSQYSVTVAADELTLHVEKSNLAFCSLVDRHPVDSAMAKLVPPE